MAIEYAPIIRCDKCENWDVDWETSDDPGTHFCVMVDLFTRGDWFCAYGKRRDTGLQVCPFCSGEPMVTTAQSSTWGVALWNVCCKCGESTGWFESKEAAIEAWNRGTR